jgi:hypothetical protein
VLGGGNTDGPVEGALFSAAVGALVDAAIPKRALGGAGSIPAKSRRLMVAFTTRFQSRDVMTRP